jgi:hypothetical protein
MGGMANDEVQMTNDERMTKLEGRSKAGYILPNQFVISIASSWTMIRGVSGTTVWAFAGSSPAG